MFEVIKLLILAMPLGIFMTYGLFLLVTYSMRVKKLDLSLRQILTLYTFSATVTGGLFFTFYYLPDLFAQLDTLYYAAVIFAMVSFHHFLCFATQSGERFNKLHYLIPTLTCVGMLVFKILFLHTWEQQSSVLFIIVLFWGIAYSLLPLYEIHIYQLKQSIAASNPQAIDKSRAALFVGEVFLFPVVFILFPFYGGQQPTLFVSMLLMLSILVALTMNIPLVYAIIRHYTSDTQRNSLFALVIPSIEPTALASSLLEPTEVRISPKENPKKGKRTPQIPPSELDKKMFNAYFRTQKPYLNPNLTIADVAEQLESNRTYISNFVNATYRMNFSNYVNRYRLREMNRLLAMPLNKEKRPTEVIGKTGFGTYRNYLRAKRQFTKIKKSPDTIIDATTDSESE